MTPHSSTVFRSPDITSWCKRPDNKLMKIYIFGWTYQLTWGLNPGVLYWPFVMTESMLQLSNTNISSFTLWHTHADLARIYIRSKNSFLMSGSGISFVICFYSGSFRRLYVTQITSARRVGAGFDCTSYHHFRAESGEIRMPIIDLWFFPHLMSPLEPQILSVPLFPCFSESASILDCLFCCSVVLSVSYTTL